MQCIFHRYKHKKPRIQEEGNTNLFFLFFCRLLLKFCLQLFKFHQICLLGLYLISCWGLDQHGCARWQMESFRIVEKLRTEAVIFLQTPATAFVEFSSLMKRSRWKSVIPAEEMTQTRKKNTTAFIQKGTQQSTTWLGKHPG